MAVMAMDTYSLTSSGSHVTAVNNSEKIGKLRLKFKMVFSYKDKLCQPKKSSTNFTKTSEK